MHNKQRDEKIIGYFDNDKLNDPNTTPTKVIKLLHDQIAEHLSDIFNLPFETGVFFNSFKVAIIKRIHEKRLKSNNLKL